MRPLVFFTVDKEIIAKFLVLFILLFLSEVGKAVLEAIIESFKCSRIRTLPTNGIMAPRNIHPVCRGIGRDRSPTRGTRSILI